MQQVTEKEFECMSEGEPVRGRLFLPAEARGAAVFSHGFNGTGAEFYAHARAFARAGYASAVFDFRGGSPRSASGGSLSSMSVLSEKADLLAVLEYLRSLGFSSFVLAGESLGGTVSVLVAAEREDVSDLVLYFPAFCFADDVRACFSCKKLIGQGRNVLGVRMTAKYSADAWDTDVYAAMRKFSGNVLIIHGTEDEVVPLCYSRRAAEVFARAKLLPVRGAKHGFSPFVAHAALRESLAFLSQKR